MSQGNHGFGSNMGSLPMRQPQFQSMGNTSPAYGQAQSFMDQQIRLMPGFQQTQPGVFGRSGSYPWPTMPGGSPVPAGPQGPYFNYNPRDPSTFNQGQDQAIGSPASVFGKSAPMGPQGFQTMPMQVERDLPMQPSAPAQQQPTLNMASINQQLLGPFGNVYNPVGSPKGGYFQGSKYVPTVGNAQTGMDHMARFGFNVPGVTY